MKLFGCFLHQEKIEVVNAQANLFAEADHFDAPAISTKKETLNARYQQLQVMTLHVSDSYSVFRNHLLDNKFLVRR